MAKIVLDKIAYEPHPVTPERKRELNKQGFKIIDARFTPEKAKSERQPLQKGPGAPAPVTGRITVAETAETRANVAIPENWQSLSWQERRSLASQLSDDPVTNGDQANAAIEAELKRRG